MSLNGLLLLITSMIIFTETVTSKENSDFKKRTGDVVEPRYNFNHPPLAQDYSPIPVSVIYDDESDFAGRSKVLTELNKSSDNITSDENVQSTTEQEDVTTPVTINDVKTKAKSKDTFLPQSRTLNNLKIPVTVIYEKDSNNNYQRTKTNTGATPRRRPHSSRKLQTKAVASTQEDQTTQAPKVETKKSQTIPADTRVFKKRTEGRSPVVPILESENYVYSHNGNFHYRYEGGDGTIAYSEGKLKTVEDKIGESVVGGYSYTDKEGNDFSLSYTADENGYRPVGAHLPTPPPIPPAIARALAYLATATPEPVTKRPAKSKPSGLQV